MLISSLFFPPPFQIGAVSHSAVTVVEGGEVSEYNILWDGREDVGHQRTFVSGNHRCVLRTKPQPNSLFFLSDSSPFHLSVASSPVLLDIALPHLIDIIYIYIYIDGSYAARAVKGNFDKGVVRVSSSRNVRTRVS